VCEEEQQEIALNTRNLGLMGGGLGGLLVGIALPYVLRRREEKNDS
jgi:prolyl oligopeptidase PreP (S9A serine peptidase family)